MTKIATVTIFILLLCVIVTQGSPIAGVKNRCRCTQTASGFVHPKRIQSLKYFPSGSHCETAEIIVVMRNGNKICVNPDAKWIKIIIAKTETNRLKQQ